MHTRYDIYRKIHKALRACMADSLLRLGRLDVDNQAEVADTMAQVRGMAQFMASHLFHEDTHVHPAMEAARAGSTRKTVAEHEHHDLACRRIITKAWAVEHAAQGDRTVLALELYRMVGVFMSENLAHMHMEDTENNAILWSFYTDEQLGALEGRIVASLSPEDRDMSARWMFAALNPQERAILLANMKKAA